MNMFRKLLNIARKVVLAGVLLVIRIAEHKGKNLVEVGIQNVVFEAATAYTKP